MKVDGKTREEENADTTSSEGLIEEDEEEKDDKSTGLDKDDLDLLDVAFLRDGITLEPESEDSGNDSDGLYDFKDTLGEQKFPIDLDSNKDDAANRRRPRPSVFLYGKRYTARYERRPAPPDPSQLVPLMSLKVPPPPSERTANSRKTTDEEYELSKLVQKLARPQRERRRRGSPELSRRRRSPISSRRRYRSRSPARRPPSRERLHRSPTGIERYRYWTGREYRSRNRSSDRRRSRYQ